MSNLNMDRRTFVAGASALAATGVLAGCSSSDSDSGSSSGSASSSDSASFKIGGIGPLTGAAALYGVAAQNGAQIAVDELNAEGNISIDFSFEDDEHDAEKSVNAYNTLKDWGMQILVGCVTTTPCVAVTAETNTDNMFQLTPSASSVDVIGDDTGEYSSEPRKSNVFQMCFTDPNQGTASAQYISEQGLGTKIGIIYNNSDAYSTGIYQKFIEEADTLGLEVVSTTTFTDDTATDFSVQIADCQSNEADLVFLPIYYTPAALIFEQANDVGYAPAWFGVDGMDGILDVEGFDTSLAEGVMLLTPFVADATDDLTVNFVTTYEEEFNETPIQFAADGYDCVKMIAQLIEESGVTADMEISDMCDAMVETLTGGSFSYDGLTGTGMTWSDTGEVSKEPKGMVIQDGAYVSLDA